MKLVTKQGIDCLKVLQSGRPYRCDSSKSFWRDDFAKAYDWMANEMCRRIGEPPKGTKWPIWAWYDTIGRMVAVSQSIGGKMKNYDQRIS